MRPRSGARLALGPLFARAATCAAALLVASCSGAPERTGAAPCVTSSAPALPAPPSSSSVVRALPKGPVDGARVAVGVHGAVASQEGNASDVGIEILRRGGNAVDAAIAVAFALAVTHPSAGNVGGGGFMLVRMADGSTTAIDYRETAPAASSRDMYLDAKGDLTKDRLVGAKAAGIPGTVAGLFLAHERLGKLPWKDLVTPAVALAQGGFTLDPVTAEDLAKVLPTLKEAHMDEAARVLARPDGTPLRAGDRFVQPELAKTLGLVAEGGAKAFYTGPLAETMAREVSKAGGIWTPADLASYRALVRDPIRFSYRGHEIIAMPPPSAGGIVLRQLLGAAEVLHLETKPWRSADEVHLFAEAMRRTYADRNELLGDPDFVKIPMKELLDPSYIAGRVKDVDPAKATPSSQIKAGIEPGHESTQTTHFSVVDEAGDAVSNTYTLNTGYGSKFMIPGTGVLLNNEMDDFATKPGSANVFGLVQGERNRIEPKKRMLSSMTPTIVVKDGRLRAVVGSPGGPTISTTVAQIIRGLIDYGRPLDEVIPAYRAHHQWLPDMIFTEEGMPKDVEAALVAKGHVVKRQPRIGHANCIEVDPATNGFRAVADTTRGGGKAAAY